MMKANEGRDCDGSLESPLHGEGEGTACEGPSARDAVTGIVRRGTITQLAEVGPAQTAETQARD